MRKKSLNLKIVELAKSKNDIENVSIMLSPCSDGTSGVACGGCHGTLGADGRGLNAAFGTAAAAAFGQAVGGTYGGIAAASAAQSIGHLGSGSGYANSGDGGGGGK